MLSSEPAPSPVAGAAPQSWRTLQLLAVGTAFTVAIGLILLLPAMTSRSRFNLTVGAVAGEDIRATRQISYISNIETQAAREEARASVEDIYDPPDPRTGRQQVRRARQLMDFVQDVRADSFASADLKRSYLDRVSIITLEPDVRDSLLAMSDSELEQLEREVVALVEEVMSGSVREGRVEDASSGLELSVSTDLPDALIPTSVNLAKSLIIANSRLNEAATEAARLQAEAAAPEIRHTYQTGEIIIRAGERIDEIDLEALQALGLVDERITWREAIASILAAGIATAVLGTHLAAVRPSWAERIAYLLLVGLLFCLFLAAAQVMIPGRGAAALLFPAAALSLSLTALVGLEMAALSAVVLAGLAGTLAGGSLEIAAYCATGGLLAAGSLRRDGRPNSFFLSGLAAAVGQAGVLLAFRLPAGTDSLRLVQMMASVLLSGFLSAGLALAILFVIGGTTGITTRLQLLDLMRPDHPLQRLMQRQALGSYQHTLSVANLVEAAAEACGADSLLARIGALYHDIGKASNPGFFVENRLEGNPNPHETLTPLTSARIIRAHVEDGLKLARRYRLPAAVTAFIPEHHGTTPIAYFLSKAREHAEATGTTLDEREYQYQGPIPQSREAAILMLADGCESAVRANRPATVEAMEQIVDRIIRQRMDQHQLDASNLTLTDIRAIRDAFVRTLRGMYHPRLQYPDEGPNKPGATPVGEAVPTEEPSLQT